MIKVINCCTVEYTVGFTNLSIKLTNIYSFPHEVHFYSIVAYSHYIQGRDGPQGPTGKTGVKGDEVMLFFFNLL